MQGLRVLEAHASYSCLRKAENSHTDEHPERDQISRSQGRYLSAVLTLADKIPARVVCGVVIEYALHPAACSDNEEQQQERAAGHDEALDGVSDNYRLEASERRIHYDDSGEQHQSANVGQACYCLDQCSTALELSDHLSDKEHYQHDAADDVYCRRFVSRSEIVRDRYSFDAARNDAKLLSNHSESKEGCSDLYGRDPRLREAPACRKARPAEERACACICRDQCHCEHYAAHRTSADEVVLDKAAFSVLLCGLMAHPYAYNCVNSHVCEEYREYRCLSACHLTPPLPLLHPHPRG